MSRKKPAFTAKIKIKKGDTVKVIAGGSRGRTGEVLQVFPRENTAIVDGANVRVKHLKATEQDAGGRVDKVMPIHISNLAVLDSAGNVSRVGRREENGKNVRYTKSNGQTLA